MLDLLLPSLELELPMPLCERLNCSVTPPSGNHSPSRPLMVVLALCVSMLSARVLLCEFLNGLTLSVTPAPRMRGST